ncbi:MAG: DUF3419 family protein [Gammaproteobacteria bacterium]|nr:DUF3419 family protein [Gammaproteobacteria bacterium]
MNDVCGKGGSWLERASALPVAFAQVREDALVDFDVVRSVGKGARVAMVASGGCTVALLASMADVAHLHCVDPNPAQLALTRLKLRLLEATSPEERLALLGHAPMAPAERGRRLIGELAALDLPRDALGSIPLVSRIGPDHAGRFEFLFAALREALHGSVEPINALLSLGDPARQAERVAPQTNLGQCIDQALGDVMGRSNLVCLFGEAAVRNPAAPFSSHFRGRLRHVLATLPANDNPYLWQMLKGCYPPGSMSPWLARPCPARIPSVTWELGTMVGALADRPGAFDFVHLSNILDWLDPDDARTTLDQARKALRPGGWTLVRQLNSTLDIERLGDGFEWHGARARRLHEADRSFFYRALYLGRRR